MTFAYPLVLLLLILPVLYIVWLWRRHGQRVVMPFDHGVQKRGTTLKASLNTVEMLTPLVLAIVIVILAGPQQLSEPKTKKVLTNIQFCLDVSGSMTAKFGEGNRYDAAMESINEFIDYRGGDAFGLTVFGDHFLHWVPLTDDTSAFKCAPPFLSPRSLPRWFGQGTRIGNALKECMKVMVQREEGDRMIILLSDGHSFDLRNGTDEEVARQLKNANIAVYTIHVGEGAPPDPLYTITSRTGGEVFAAGDPEGLKAVFKRIDEMQVTRMERTSAEAMDNFFPFCVAGLSVLGLHLLSLLGLRYTPW